VIKQFVSEGEMMYQEHWFQNGNGLDEQRRYYTQYKMLGRYGGEIGEETD